MRTRKIRVLFIIDFIYTLSGGTENQLLKILNNLDRDRFDIYLLTLRNTEWIRNNRKEIKCKTKILNIVKLRNPKHLLQIFYIYLYIRRLRPDTVITFFPFSNIIGVIVSKLARVRNIFSTRRDYGLWFLKKNIFLLRIANKFVKRIITNSDKVKELVCYGEKLDCNKVDVIYNGIDITSIKNYIEDKEKTKKEIGIPKDSIVVGTIAGLKPMKRHDVIIKAAKEVTNKKKNVHFVIVGDGIMRKDLEISVKKLGISNNVHFVGNQENILRFLAIFDLAVNSSANEGLSNAIMEYMAYKIPCVVSIAGGNTDLIEDRKSGYTFQYGNHNELADKMLLLIENKSHRYELSKCAYERVVKIFSLNKMIKNYEDYIIKNLSR